MQIRFGLIVVLATFAAVAAGIATQATIPAPGPVGHRSGAAPVYPSAWPPVQTAAAVILTELREKVEGEWAAAWRTLYPLHRQAIAAPAVGGIAGGPNVLATPAAWPSCSATTGLSVPQLRAEVRKGHIREMLWVNLCGPANVVRGVNYSYSVVVTNIGDRRYRHFKLVVSHYEPLTRSSRPYRRLPSPIGDSRLRAEVWTVRELKPGRSVRISFTLPFRQHSDRFGSTLEIDAFAPRLVYWGVTHDVFFVTRPRHGNRHQPLSPCGAGCASRPSRTGRCSSWYARVPRSPRRASRPACGRDRGR